MKPAFPARLPTERAGCELYLESGRNSRVLPSLSGMDPANMARAVLPLSRILLLNAVWALALPQGVPFPSRPLTWRNSVYSATTFWLAVAAALVVGLVAGSVLNRQLGSSGAGLLRSREAQRQLDAMRQEQQHYRDQVTGHFQRTAELVNELTANYRAVHNHLAQGARDLCPEGGGSMPHLPEPAVQGGPRGSSMAGSPLEPPRDYAPKGHSDIGALDEAYGLDKKHRGATPEPPRS